MDFNFAPNIYDNSDCNLNFAPLDLSTRNVTADDMQIVENANGTPEMFICPGRAVFARNEFADKSGKTRRYYGRPAGRKRRRGKRGGGRGGARVGTTAVTSHVKELPAETDLEPRCDFCLLTAKTNPSGEYEELLVCSDCGAKAHPSCMNYDLELAQRTRLTRWQCISCKTCTICRDPGDDDTMLFCDYCDKGYHMNCHRPKVNEKPNGKWACYSCQVELNPAKEVTISNHNSATEQALYLFTAGYQNCNGSTNHCMEIDRFLRDYPNTIPDASNWTIEDVEHFVTKVGFPDQAPYFREQEIDGRSLLLMKRNDVLTGLSIRLGPALKIYNHIRRLQVFFGISHSCSS